MLSEIEMENEQLNFNNALNIFFKRKAFNEIHLVDVLAAHKWMAQFSLPKMVALLRQDWRRMISISINAIIGISGRKCLDIKALKEQSAMEVAKALLEVFCTVGFPRIVSSDNGSEFVIEIIRELCRISGIDHRLISAYHHRAYGIAERNIRTMSEVINKELTGVGEDWDLVMFNQFPS